MNFLKLTLAGEKSVYINMALVTEVREIITSTCKSRLYFLDAENHTDVIETPEEIMRQC